MRGKLGSRLLLCLLTLLLGVAIVAQFRSRGRAHSTIADPGSGQGTNLGDQSLLLSGLVDANRSLRAEIESLRAQQVAYEREGRGAGMQELVTELNRVKVLTGSIEVSGPGVELWVDGPLNALDLQDLVNELYNAGAEVVSLNEHRLVVDSRWMTESGGQVTVDGQPLDRPFHLLAIGDPATIETAVLRPGGLVPLFRRAYPGLVVRSEQRSRLVLGVNREQGDLRYARPLD